MLAGARVRGREDDGDGSALGGGEGSVPLSLLVLLGCWCARLVRSCSCCGFGQDWSFSVPAGVAARVGMGVGGRGGAVGNGRGVVVLGLGRLGVEGGGRRYCNSSSSSSSGSNRARTISRAGDRHGGTVAGAAGL